MKTKKMIRLWKLCSMLVAICFISIPSLANAVLPIPLGPLDANGNPAVPDYYTTANWANSPPLAKFVDTLPGLGSGKANNLGQYLSIGKPDITTYPGSDYYEINLVEYKERMHSDLPATGTLLRGYVQVNLGTNISSGTLPSQNLCGADRHTCTSADTASGTGVTPDTVHYLGPTIISERDRPVRIKFTNRLPSGTAGDLFIPVDTTVMGAGPGPAYLGATRGQGAPCDNTADNNTCASYTQNRGLIHLHGGRTPWISDGTPHQWITPVEENTPFTKGVSFQNVPDMPDPGDGSMTYYYTNQQSSRLMFYHDHSWGITRLNVYAGGAAGYLIADKYEQDLITRGLIPPDQIPLILQDKTYVDATPVAHPVSGIITPKIRVTDPLWNWGSAAAVDGVRAPVTGDLWLPHVYMPAQTLAAGFGGVNPFGRWMYGPWFYPATAVTKGPVANPYYDPNCSSSNPLELATCETPGQPPLIPGTPNVSMGMEAFQDSAVVNGTAFPSLTVDPRAYRFRILNAASDRFFNLSFYQADPTQVSPDTRPASRLTEVKMVPASVNSAWPPLWPVDGREGGVPDPAFKGPNFLQIGTDSGFLPQPVEIEPQPITYNIDPTAFWVGNVDKMALAVGPAERVDVIVDFSAYAGKTLILYNDAPAAWPAGVAGYDYYTGAPDMRDSGGFGTGGTYDPASGTWENGTGPLVGYAPNTRTVMQVIVRPAGSVVDGAYSFDRTNLEKEFTAAAPVTALNPAPAKTLFERAQEPIIVGQAAYKNAYPNSYFPTNFPLEGVNQINDHFLRFVTLTGKEVKVRTEPKGIHDEMGASFDPVYGRMSGNLAMQLPNPTTLNANLILYGFSDIPTETIDNSTTVNITLISDTDPLSISYNYNKPADGTQIWKISHNGVDTHPIHFHIFDVQLINRVGWDGQILLPEPNELGWKEVVKISPLEDTIVAVRPRAPALPFGITNSLRPLNPSIPIGSTMGFNSVDWTTGLARNPVVTNILYDFGWEYVWHCHILSHEEMDMMRPIVLKYVASAPPPFTAKATQNGGNVDITWNDPTPINYTTYSTYGNTANEVGFNVLRSTDGTIFTKVNTANLLANSTSFIDTSPVADAVYKVEAFNPAGSTYSPAVRPLSVTVAVTNGPTFTAPATVNLEATIAPLPAGVTIARYDFYNDTTRISPPGGATSSFSWTPVMGGTYSITAKATDNLGGTTTSPAITVTVTSSITADFNVTGSTSGLGSSFGFCEALTFASSSNGAVTGYSWDINGSLYNSSTVTTTLPIGIYPVILGVVNGATTETAQITKNITIVNHNPIAITGGSYTVVPGGSLTLNGSGTDLLDSCNTGALTYAWNVDNRGLYDYFTANPTIPYNTLKTALGIGTHTMTFKVTDSNGGVGTATTSLEVLPAGTIQVNSGAAVTNSLTVTLAMTVYPGAGITNMRFSNDGINYTADETYAATKAWTLTAGDGVKTVYVRFSDGAGHLYDAINDQITLDTIAPITSPSTAPGTFIAPVSLALTANEPYSTIKYTIDGSDPTTSATAVIYSAAIPITATTTLKYFATDPAGNAEVVKTGTYAIHTADLVVNTFTINAGAAATNLTAVTLTIAATDATGVAKMRFSSDGVNYSVDEAYATTKALALTSGDGVKTVYVRFTDGAGILYDAVTTQITLDTVAPVTTPSTVPGTFINPVSVSLAANEPNSVIKYTNDGSNPTTSATAVTYSAAIPIAATTTLKYFATDIAGNAEAVKTSTYTIHTADLVVSTFNINAGAAVTNSTAVTLTIAATDATGVAKMRFSSDGVNYTADEAYATTKSWTLTSGDGVKTVYAGFTDGAGILYNAVTTQITLDTVAPVTTPSTVPGTFIAPVNVTLSANEPNSVIKYTLDGSDPTTSSTARNFFAVIPIVATTTLKYFATDIAGNAEMVKTGTYTIHTADLVVNTFTINGGAAVTNSTAVTLTIAATDATGVAKMRFSSDGVNYTADEAYATTKSLTLTPGDGVKTVYARFTDGAGLLYDAVTTQITLDTVAPVTTPSTTPGTFIAPVNVSLSANNPSSVIKYTIDGTDPTTSTTAVIYSTPIQISATTTLKYFATSLSGNAEAVKTSTYTIHEADLVVNTFTINGGAAVTNSTAVTLTIAATDAAGVTKMRFSSDGVNYTADEAYATTKAWTFSSENGVKTVYVRFTDGAGILYDAVTAQITLATRDGIMPGSTSLLASALRCLQITKGKIVPTALELVHGDVAPYYSGASHPDGKINLGDVSVILMRAVGSISGF